MLECEPKTTATPQPFYRLSNSSTTTMNVIRQNFEGSNTTPMTADYLNHHGDSCSDNECGANSTSSQATATGGGVTSFSEKCGSFVDGDNNNEVGDGEAGCFGISGKMTPVMDQPNPFHHLQQQQQQLDERRRKMKIEGDEDGDEEFLRQIRGCMGR